MYLAVAMDEHGCTGGQAFALEKPKQGSTPEPAWRLGGNSGQDNWLGTNDSTDVVMKANNQPMLRLGADGVTEVMGMLRLGGLQQVTVDGTEGGPQILVINPDGSVASGGLPWLQGVGPNPADGGCFDDPDNTPMIGSWSYGQNKIYTCPQVNVGIGYENPAYDLHVKGDGKFSGDLWVTSSYAMKARIGTLSVPTSEQILYVKANNSIDNAVLMTTALGEEMFSVSKEGRTRIGYRDGVGTTYVNAMLDLRADDNTAAFTFEALDNAGLSSFRVRNNGKVIVGNGAYVNGEVANLYIGNESRFMSSIPDVGISLSVESHQDAFVIDKNSGDVLVSGAIRACKLVIEVLSGCDYVFDPEYQLPILAERKRQIVSTGHLVGVPAAIEMEREGMNLSETALGILRNVEEHELYLYHHDSELSDLRAIVQHQQKLIYEQHKALNMLIRQMEEMQCKLSEK